MSYRLVVKEEAVLDMQLAYLYYEQQLSGLGERFLDKVQERFTDLTAHPEYYSYIDSKQLLRDVTVEKFPFVVVYEIDGSEVIVYAICSTYKKPADS